MVWLWFDPQTVDFEREIIAVVVDRTSFFAYLTAGLEEFGLRALASRDIDILPCFEQHVGINPVAKLRWQFEKMRRRVTVFDSRRTFRDSFGLVFISLH
jgi:hypothetical protein